MRSPLQTPKFDVVDFESGGISLPPLWKIIDNLGFDTEHKSNISRKNIFHKYKVEKVHQHKSYKGLTMVFYDYKDEIDFLKNNELIYTSKGSYHCHINCDKIIREINLSRLI